MDISVVASILREALMVVIKLSMPALLLCLVVGVLIAIFQAVTQIHEQSLGFILKLVVVMLVLLVGGGWMLRSLQEYTMQIFELIAS